MTNIWEKFVNFLIFVIDLVKGIHLFGPFTRSPGSPQQSPSSPQLPTTQGTQANATHPTDRQPPPSDSDVYMKIQLPLSIIGVCFTAVGTTLLPPQTPKPLPMTFHWFCLALELSFLCVIVSMYIRRCIQVASLVMDHAALFLASTAFMLAISMNFPIPFLGITAAVYFIAILLIVFANLLMPRDTSNPTTQGTQANATHSTDQQPPPSNTDVYMKIQLPLSIIGVCFTAVGTTLLPPQTPKPLPMTFHWFCLALELSFLCVIVSMYIRRCIQVASLVMDHAAIFLASTALMLAISMNFPTPFLGITVALYFIAILLIVFANLLMPRDTSNP